MPTSSLTKDDMAVSKCPFFVHVLMYTTKAARQVIRRATPARIAEAAEAIDIYLAERPEACAGDTARTH
ncbi:hypothetical protein GN958_ATG23152 [Phytophthora infestans]|uniref:Uncharacterized protein n=1 Tax=Phytophthora infestans TaxID=4787 RepID=A0A8S9TGG1_PHYIN|nr:hypothetical protein GN958_ATG23152 [Phytophthora infestans]